ncbi:hypothetical protein KIW84_043892 [Lathyrus oleraceus]|uniref:Uncharacterized protein n=1 Tax=Pisum sativum TaxID=3888 RepID=A0A9D4XJ87_PEA|nr:hypothetical protein KIW84_043892 [Pisum sativum]
MEDNWPDEDIENELSPIAVQLCYVQQLLGRKQDAIEAYVDMIKRDMADESSIAVPYVTEAGGYRHAFGDGSACRGNFESKFLMQMWNRLLTVDVLCYWTNKAMLTTQKPDILCKQPEQESPCIQYLKAMLISSGHAGEPGSGDVYECAFLEKLIHYPKFSL